MYEENQFWKVKEYLYRALNGKRKVVLLQRRIELRDVADQDYDDLKKELETAEEEQNKTEIEVTDFISNLPDVNQQLVMIKKYVDGESWEEIADDLVISVRGAQKMQGRALPILKELYDGQYADE